MKNKLNRVTIFCSSSEKINSYFFEKTKIICEELISENVEIIYGGGDTGLMGVIQRTVLEKNGKSTAVRPSFLNEIETSSILKENIIFVESMSERKRLLTVDTDAVIVLPGGTGTLDELFELLTLKRLGKFPKPIIIVNLLDYFDEIINFMDKMIREKFMDSIHRKLWTISNEAENICHIIENSDKWLNEYINYAVYSKK